MKNAAGILLPVTEIQRFSTQDGPGIRTTVFLKGCPLRCKWCHNPETQSSLPQIFYMKQNCIMCGACVKTCKSGAHFFDKDNRHSFDVSRCTGCLSCAKACAADAIKTVGKMMSVQEIMDAVLRDKAFYGDNGGVTLSGGEPLMHVKGCIELLGAIQKNGVSTAVETSGYFDISSAERLTDTVDVFLWDFKDGNAARHLKYTNVSNKKIIENLMLIDEKAKKTILRCIMVKNINMDSENFQAIACTYRKLKHCGGVELIPYHAYGGSKNEQSGHIDNSRKDWIPSENDMTAAKKTIRRLGCKIIT